ncbi:hypothetical protein GQ53DRAFT_847536 [Thozetella sp. PMI_491]|nr:hypothetical protein GQ53DRAFT_847536 [Thozetella sp. PMI_491]
MTLVVAPNQGDKALAFSAVKSLFAALDGTPPLTDARKYVLEDGFSILSHKDELLRSTLGEAINREEAVRAGRKHETTFSEPGPEVWVYDNLAAVFTGYTVKVDGTETFRGARLFSLLKIEDEYKVTTIAGVQTSCTDVAVASDADGEIMTTIDAFFDCLKKQDWDGFDPLILPDAGACLSRPPAPPLICAWPAFFDRLKAVVASLPPGSVIEEPIHDIEIRAIGDLGFVWAPFEVLLNGAPRSKGNNIMTLLKKDGRWLISGCQDLGRPVA